MLKILFIPIFVSISIALFIFLLIEKRREKFVVDIKPEVINESITQKIEGILTVIGDRYIPIVEIELNKVLQKPITVGKPCKSILLSNLDVGKCFSLNSSGYWNGGSEFVETITKAGCYTGCHTLNSYRWACCKLPSFLDCGSCPDTICKKKCSKGLISWWCKLGKMTGFNSVIFTELNLINASFSGSKYVINLMIKGKSNDNVKLKVEAGIGGLLSLIPNLVKIPTSGEGVADINNIRFSSNVQIVFECVKGKFAFSKIKIEDVDVNITGDIKVFLDTLPYFDKISSISSKLANKMTNSVNNLFNSLADKHLQGVLKGVIDKTVNSQVAVLKHIQLPC